MHPGRLSLWLSRHVTWHGHRRKWVAGFRFGKEQGTVAGSGSVSRRAVGHFEFGDFVLAESAAKLLDRIVRRDSDRGVETPW